MEIKNISQTYELKIQEVELEKSKITELIRNKERIIKDMKARIREKDSLMEQQAKRIDDLVCNLRSIKDKHDTHLQRLRLKH